MKRDINLFIWDILESVKNIEDFSKGLDERGFASDLLRQSAIIRQLEIIGEAVKNLPDSFRKEHPKIPWKDIAGFRDILSHAYFGVNISRVWNILENDLPILKKELKTVTLSTNSVEDVRKARKNLSKQIKKEDLDKINRL